MSTPPALTPPALTPAVADLVAGTVAERERDLVALRRELHAHPELSWAEEQTTERLLAAVGSLGWRTRLLPRSGFVADLGEEGPLVALRTDLDALPVQEVSSEPFASTVPGVAHACGHDVHMTSVVGAAAALSAVHAAGLLPGRVRLLFQPAEEVMPGGALAMVEEGHLDRVERIFALHCDPAVEVGRVALTPGPLTSAADMVEIRLEGVGGHTSRPHLTGDLTFALAKVTTELPAILSRRLDPRAGVSVVWGVLRAGAAPNVIPRDGLLAGTVRVLDRDAWAECEDFVRRLVPEIVRPYGVTAHLEYHRGVPPVVNDPAAHAALVAAATALLGPGHADKASQSLGGEDFGWYTDRVPGAMFRLGTRAPGGRVYDLHQGDLHVDEGAITVGARMLAGAAVAGLASLGG
ncbi:amidohydrolase [Nocardioides sp. GY 10127]|uniref:amidohydrolase n=1 Tax=Nocardioides sp. GY 10127 TaxID=2569762 RepID=UPI0010A81D53|nr:amidohydrolase [Nocardioides sp. GY 10127]TIC84293.1 amidohydrolase [Nocardioides sp. GY 10127]